MGEDEDALVPSPPSPAPQAIEVTGPPPPSPPPDMVVGSVVMSRPLAAADVAGVAPTIGIASAAAEAAS